jgi:hypothetical protein
LGLASTIAFEEQDGRELSIGGLSLPIAIAVGGVVLPNLALYGELHGTSVPEPTVTVDDVDRDVDRVFAGSLGVGATYYLMPHDFHIGGSVGIGSANVYLSDLSDEPEGGTGAGIALRLVVGKEWWTGPQWGFGAAAHLLFMSLPDGDSSTLTLFSVGVSATATYN